MNVPKLRFKDKNKAEYPEWELKALSDIGEIVTGKTPSTSDDSLWNGEIQFVTPTDISDQKYQKKTLRMVTNHPKLKVLPTGTVMFTCIASIGKMSISTQPCITNQQINSIVPTIKHYNEYVYYAILSISDFIKSTQANTTLPIINKSDFSRFEIPVPSYPEQQKIADFLSAVDEKITALTAQKTAFTQYKQGMMQRIFSQTLRFKDDNGADYPDWEKKALGEISLFITNGLALEQNQEQSGYKVTRIETISDKKINLNKVGYVETEQDISDYKLYVGDILLSNINSISHIGKVVYVDDDYDLYHGMNLLRISIMKEKHDSKFVFFQLSTPHMKQEFETKANKAVNQASINQTEIKKLILQVPSLAEQTKVAQFLTECDDKINAVDAQIQSAQQWKQGLLQQMFV